MLLLVTDPIFMRGEDYRSSKNGVTLIIARSFANARDAQ
jgi:hypothetical protein